MPLMMILNPPLLVKVGFIRKVSTYWKWSAGCATYAIFGNSFSYIPLNNKKKVCRISFMGLTLWFSGLSINTCTKCEKFNIWSHAEHPNDQQWKTPFIFVVVIAFQLWFIMFETFLEWIVVFIYISMLEGQRYCETCRNRL